jgi:hypothetical protein
MATGGMFPRSMFQWRSPRDRLSPPGFILPCQPILAPQVPVGPDWIWYSSNVPGGDGEALFRHACWMKLEGIVSKRIDTPYKSGPFSGWRKILCPFYARP